MGTPPHALRVPANARGDARKKTIDTFKDSGYYSSIESSALRGQHAAPVAVTSDADYERSAMKRGRAEEELARIRGSSYDPSPTKSKAFRRPGSYLISSSPLRNFDSAGFPPLTPGTHLKVPYYGPPTVSPNTHLRRHRENVRELVGTPSHAVSTAVTPARGIQTWTPAFTIYKDDHDHHDAVSDAGIYTTPGGISVSEFHALNTWDAEPENAIFENYDTFFARGSPMKATVKRPLLHRAATASGVLADVTGSRLNIPNAVQLGSPFKALPPRRDGQAFETPLHMMTAPIPQTVFNPATPLRNVQHVEPAPNPDQFTAIQEDLWQAYLDNDESEVLSGLDLAAGFRSICADTLYENKENNAFLMAQDMVQHPQGMGLAIGKAGRPSFGRSMTNNY